MRFIKKVILLSYVERLLKFFRKEKNFTKRNKGHKERYGYVYT